MSTIVSAASFAMLLLMACLFTVLFETNRGYLANNKIATQCGLREERVLHCSVFVWQVVWSLCLVLLPVQVFHLFVTDCPFLF